MRDFSLKSFYFIFTVISALMFTSVAFAENPVQTHVPQAKTVGKGTFNYLFMHVYDAELLAPEGEYSQEAPYALSLSYARSLSGQDIADESINQMKKQGWSDEAQLEDWRAQMTAIFPDVSKGTVLTGIRDANGDTLFFNGQSQIGKVNGPAFTDAFFGIWLDEKTTEPKLRSALLGTAK